MSNTRTAAARRPAPVAAPAAPKRPGKPVAAPVAAALARKPRNAQAATVVASAPSAPARPGKPVAAPAAAAPVVQTPAAPAAVPGVGREILAMLAGMQAQIEALTKKAASTPATNAKLRTREQITDGITARAGDWRGEYHGFEMPIKRCNREKGGTLTVLDGTIPGCLLAIPRDNDVGGEGANARGAGLLAVHWEASEDGASYIGAPLYVSPDELGSIWSD
jgi:hypothetical protein